MSEQRSHSKLSSPPEFISIISSNQCARIKIEDIELIEQESRRVHIVTAERDYSFYGEINSIAVALADRAFYRVLKSVIVNFDHVRDIRGISINFKSGKSMTLGRNTISKTKRAYKRYLMKYPPYTFWDPSHMMAMGVCESGSVMPEIDSDMLN